jgi:methionine-gamma-lyase
MSAHSKMAEFLANRMAEMKIPVIYPSLSNHPQGKLIREMANPNYGFGGILTVDCGTSDRARVLATKLQDEKFGLYAVSLGFSRTLMSCSAKSTSSEIPEEQQKEIGLSPGLLRFSIGYLGDPETMWTRFLKCWKSV